MLRGFIRWWRGPEPPAPRRESAGPTRQSGAAPYRLTRKGVLVLLVTSRRTGRWLFPKGGLMAGREPWESAAQEAFEEAGVQGLADREPLGAYQSRRVRNGRAEQIEVVIYPLEVTRQLDRWPERGQRRRRWMSLEEARRRLSDADLVRMTEVLEQRLRDRQPARPPPALRTGSKG
ncbi:NUDIX hydrolase [Phenylobacterium sp.]|uniref:NUDIX hydrolase n=1 Tax=Phenylobacterium sp. TaxID=1871053 RepID=UPI002FD990C4